MVTVIPDQKLVAKAKTNKEANSHNYADELSKTKTDIAIKVRYFFSFMTAAIIVVVASWALSLLDYPATNGILLTLMGAVFGSFATMAFDKK